MASNSLQDLRFQAFLEVVCRSALVRLPASTFSLLHYYCSRFSTHPCLIVRYILGWSRSTDWATRRIDTSRPESPLGFCLGLCLRDGTLEVVLVSQVFLHWQTLPMMQWHTLNFLLKSIAKTRKLSFHIWVYIWRLADRTDPGETRRITSVVPMFSVRKFDSSESNFTICYRYVSSVLSDDYGWMLTLLAFCAALTFWLKEANTACWRNV